MFAAPAPSAALHRRLLTLLLAGTGVAALSAPAAALAAPGLEVVPLPSAGPALSYFRLSPVAGKRLAAGEIELRNLSSRPIRVGLEPVAGETIGTLGSTYSPPGRQLDASGPVAWIRLERSRLTLSPRSRARVAVGVTPAAGARPGDYLAGISVESLDQAAQSSRHGGASIASAVRYAIGVEMSLPGPRHPLLAFTGARLERQPSGLTFLLDARNPGNVILQNVHGQATITRGSRVVAKVPLGPGTFVTQTAIAYPVLARQERPRQGTVYRVRAFLRYAGGIARLDTKVRFGHADAVLQQAYGGPPASGGSGTPAWLIALASAVGLAALAGGGGLWRARRLRDIRGHRPLSAIETALTNSRQKGQPLSLITVASRSEHPDALFSAVRSRLRPTDRLCRLNGSALLVVAEDTDLETARALAADLERRAARNLGTGGLAVSAQDGNHGSSAAELLGRIIASTETAADTAAG